MPRIRVFNVIAASGAGGAEEAFATLVQRLDPVRFETAVACHGEGWMVERFRRHAAQVTSHDLVDLRRPRTVTELAGLMREWRPDVVHTHLWTADVFGGVAARRAGVRGIVSSVQGAYFRPTGVTGLRRVRRLGFSRIFRVIYRRCDRVIAASRHVADDLVTRPGIKVRREKITVIENGVDVHDVERLTRAKGHGSSDRWGSGAPRIAVVANFFPYKGHSYLMRAIPKVLAAYPEARFVLAGEGENRSEMAALAHTLGVGERVSFPGEITDALDLVRASDLFVLPSVSSEGLPVTLVEAMALGCPVVTTSAGGIPEIAEDGVTARVVPPRDPEALGEAIVELLSSPELAQRLCARAQVVAQGRFSADRMVRRIEQVYLGLHGGQE